MSLLEDVFLGDEAGEAQELERIVEGDEFDDQRRDGDDDDGGGGEDEAEEDKRRVDPTKEAKATRVKNPRFVLNPARLTGPRGIQLIPEHFKEFKFKGKGHEKEDLDVVLKKLEHWAYRLYPKFTFTDCLKKMETLGKKRVVMVTLNKIRNGQLTDEPVVQKDSSDEEVTPVVQEEDEFDKLLQQQIDIARQTPGHNSVKKPIGTPARETGTPFMMPKATSSPSISDEQKERIMKNRRLAEERRLARMKQNSAVANVSNGHFDTINEENDNDEVVDLTENATNSDRVVDLTGNMATDKEIVDITEMPNEVRKKHNRPNVIDSSDESEAETMTESVAADVHKSVNVTETNDDTENATNSDRVVDLTGNMANTTTDKEIVDITEMPNEVRKKHNRPNVIDSSDESEAETMTESVAADVHKSVNVIETNDDSDSTNEDGEKIVDLTGTEVVDLDIPTNVGRKSNVIYSSDSDEECEVQAMNKSIRVDIHNSVNQYNDMEKVTNDNGNVVAEREANGLENYDKIHSDETNVPSNDITEKGITNNREIQENEKTNTNEKNDGGGMSIRVDNKENIDNNIETVDTAEASVGDEVMDVDFSVDF